MYPVLVNPVVRSLDLGRTESGWGGPHATLLTCRRRSPGPVPEARNEPPPGRLPRTSSGGSNRPRARNCCRRAESGVRRSPHIRSWPRASRASCHCGPARRPWPLAEAASPRCPRALALPLCPLLCCSALALLLRPRSPGPGLSSALALLGLGSVLPLACPSALLRSAFALRLCPLLGSSALVPLCPCSAPCFAPLLLLGPDLAPLLCP